MTGSGPTMVVLLDKPMEALQLQEEIKQQAMIGYRSLQKT